MMSLRVKDSDLNRRGRLVRATLAAEVPAGADGQGLGVGLCVGERRAGNRTELETSFPPRSPLKSKPLCWKITGPNHMKDYVQLSEDFIFPPQTQSTRALTNINIEGPT